jgi:hypothetical protein
MLAVSLCGCSNIVGIDEVIKSPDTKLIDFEVVDNNYWGAILVDKNTNVMYYWITSNAGGITPILNSDGTPKLFEEK